jgi:trimethylguanosine synthase
VIANHISKRLVGNRSDVVVLDPFCGCGGNAIAFASRPQVKMVVCVDIDMEKLKKAHHNAAIYGVETKLLLVHGNAFEVLSRYNGGKLVESNGTTNDDTASLPTTIDVVFLSPPWGGMKYEKVGKHGYDLKCIKIDAGNGTTRDGEFLLQSVGVACGHKAVGYFLPRNINGTSIARSVLRAGFSGPVVLEQNVVNGKLKTVTSYLGLDSE